MQYNWPLIGHTHLKQYFEKAFSAGRINHAYLFEGPEHLGKATLARLLSQTLLCTHPSSRPCGKCPACQAFEHNAHPDFLMLQKGEEAHLSIEQTREFIRTLLTRPLLGPKRIGIIEEAQALTLEAANALLKTLEEPGVSVVMFLVSSAEVLPTVASRCQRFVFRFVNQQEIEQALDGNSESAALSRLAAGRPGLAYTWQTEGSMSEYQAEMQELQEVVAKDESERLLWSSARFGLRGELGERRAEGVRLLSLLETVLRERLFAAPNSTGVLLKRTLEARRFLEANVDPRLAWEYVLLDHNTHST